MSNLETSGLDSNLSCPICTNLFFKPTFFECGHTMCLLCHYNIDKNSESKTFELPIFRCPQCRLTSIVPWNKRPLNIALDRICAQKHPKEYQRLAGSEEQREAKHADADPPSPPGMEPQKVDLTKIALDSRKVIAKETYSKIFPLLLKAAHDGKTFVSVREKNILRSIEISLQPLSQMFFEFNNLHKIVCSPEECTLFLCKTTSKWKREITNTEHLIDVTHEPEVRPVADDPSTPPPPTRRRRVMLRRPTVRDGTEDVSEAFGRLSSIIRMNY